MGQAHSSPVLHSSLFVHGEPTPPASIMVPGQERQAPLYAIRVGEYDPAAGHALTVVPSHAQNDSVCAHGPDAVLEGGTQVPRAEQPPSKYEKPQTIPPSHSSEVVQDPVASGAWTSRRGATSGPASLGSFAMSSLLLQPALARPKVKTKSKKGFMGAFFSFES
jgi:hypothetical protein